MKYPEKKDLSLFMLFFVQLIVLHNVFAEGPPKKLASDGHKQILFAHVNESVTLKCPVESSSEFPTFVEWIKGNASLYMMQGYEITVKGYLKIKSALFQHAGIYTCEAVNGYGFVRVNLTLVVINPEMQNNYDITNRNSATRPQSFPPTITKRPSSIKVDVDDEATFHCISSGQPVPRIFWLKDGHLIQGSNSHVSKRKTHSTLKLKGLKKSDAGTYKCIARNVIGDDEMDFSLDVTEPSPPPTIITLDPPNVTIREGASIVFVCEVVNRPGVQLHIKWLKRLDGTRESESNDINLFRSGKLFYRPLNLSESEFMTNDGVYRSKYFIRNSCEADSGTYVCLALNDKGFNVRNSTLKVIGHSKNNAFANTSQFPASGTPLAVTITAVFVVMLTVVAFVSHIIWRSKSEDKTRTDITSVPTVETESLKQRVTTDRKSNKRDFNHYPEMVNPQTTSKLLVIDSPFVYEHCESQMSKSVHTRTFH